MKISISSSNHLQKKCSLFMKTNRDLGISGKAWKTQIAHTKNRLERFRAEALTVTNWETKKKLGSSSSRSGRYRKNVFEVKKPFKEINENHFPF